MMKTLLTMKKYYIAQLAVLLAGNAVAWNAVYDDFARFFGAGGKLLQVAGCSVPNPITTPCFYGAFGFLGALVWAWIIFKKTDTIARVRQQKYLSWFLVGCTLFGGFNFTKLYLSYLHGSTIGCSGAAMTTPFATPCFYGASVFFLSLLVSWIVLWKEGK
jgi:hypothetical protein